MLVHLLDGHRLLPPGQDPSSLNSAGHSKVSQTQHGPELGQGTGYVVSHA